MSRRVVAPIVLSALCIAAAGFVSPVAGQGWTTNGTSILTPSGQRYVIAGVNWYGFETRNSVAHGMWTKDYKFILDLIKANGANVIRLPFSNEMWGSNPKPGANTISACSECKGKRARDIMALIVNYAGSIGLHIVLVNHRSNGGNSAQENGLWYTSSYPESIWIRDWLSIQEWTHGIPQTLGAPDTVIVNPIASDGFPTVIGFDLRNEPHTPARKKYLDAATWGTGDGISPSVNPNPNAFAPGCVATSTCKDWRLAAQRAGNRILGQALSRGWSYPLIFVEGVSQTPTASGTPANGPYDFYWWGGNLLGINGNAGNAGAPIVLNAGGDASSLGPPVVNQLVYSAHDYGPNLFKQPWFNSATCYASGCSPSSLADVWNKNWAHVNVAGGINPQWPGHASFPWGNTGHAAYDRAPMWVGEFGTGNTAADLDSTGAGSQGQWFTALVNFIQSSYQLTAQNDSGIPVQDLQWTYWAFNGNDSYGIVTNDWSGLANPRKEYTFLCAIQQVAVAQCGSTGALPAPQ
jgi:endoglucanase